MTEASALLTPTEAGRQLGITAAAVKAHDHRLAPIRTATGRRLYLASAITAFEAQRDARRWTP